MVEVILAPKSIFKTGNDIDFWQINPFYLRIRDKKDFQIGRSLVGKYTNLFFLDLEKWLNNPVIMIEAVLISKNI